MLFPSVVIASSGGAAGLVAVGGWKSLGGTGKFKNIKGSGTYRGKATAEGASSEFEGEVEY